MDALTSNAFDGLVLSIALRRRLGMSLDHLVGVGATVEKCFHSALASCRLERIRLSVTGAHQADASNAPALISSLPPANSGNVRSTHLSRCGIVPERINIGAAHPRWTAPNARPA